MAKVEQMAEYVSQLVSQYGEGYEVSVLDFKAGYCAKYKVQPKTIVLSHFCYNRISKGVKLDKVCFFLSVGHNKYKCVGTDYAYNGPVLQGAKIVGKCVNGVRILTKRPD